jgi:hypothetical protein
MLRLLIKHAEVYRHQVYSCQLELFYYAFRRISAEKMVILVFVLAVQNRFPFRKVS